MGCQRPFPRWSVAIAMLVTLTACSSVVRYTDELVDARYGRTWFTRLPATVGATAGFAIGIPVDIVAVPLTWAVYRTQPEESRDPLSVFLFPSFVLWKAGALLGSPFDLVEWGVWRSWQPTRPRTQEEVEAVERAWDAREYTEYPVTPLYPVPRPVEDPAAEPR